MDFIYNWKNLKFYNYKILCILNNIGCFWFLEGFWFGDCIKERYKIEVICCLIVFFIYIFLVREERGREEGERS